MIRFLLTAYCACALCTGKNHRHGLTTSGARPLAGWTAACPPYLPMGSRLWVQGYGEVICEDRGSAIQGRTVDLFMRSHWEAVRFGKRQARVVLIDAPGLP